MGEIVRTQTTGEEGDDILRVPFTSGIERETVSVPTWTVVYPKNLGEPGVEGPVLIAPGHLEYDRLVETTPQEATEDDAQPRRPIDRYPSKPMLFYPTEVTRTSLALSRAQEYVARNWRMLLAVGGVTAEVVATAWLCGQGGNFDAPTPTPAGESSHPEGIGGNFVDLTLSPNDIRNVSIIGPDEQTSEKQMLLRKVQEQWPSVVSIGLVVMPPNPEEDGMMMMLRHVAEDEQGGSYVQEFIGYGVWKDGAFEITGFWADDPNAERDIVEREPGDFYEVSYYDQLAYDPETGRIIPNGEEVRVSMPVDLFDIDGDGVKEAYYSLDPARQQFIGLPSEKTRPDRVFNVLASIPPDIEVPRMTDLPPTPGAPEEELDPVDTELNKMSNGEEVTEQEQRIMEAFGDWEEAMGWVLDENGEGPALDAATGLVALVEGMDPEDALTLVRALYASQAPENIFDLFDQADMDQEAVLDLASRILDGELVWNPNKEAFFDKDGKQVWPEVVAELVLPENAVFGEFLDPDNRVSMVVLDNSSETFNLVAGGMLQRPEGKDAGLSISAELNGYPSVYNFKNALATGNVDFERTLSHFLQTDHEVKLNLSQVEISLEDLPTGLGLENFQGFKDFNKYVERYDGWVNIDGRWMRFEPGEDGVMKIRIARRVDANYRFLNPEDDLDEDTLYYILAAFKAYAHVVNNGGDFPPDMDEKMSPPELTIWYKGVKMTIHAYVTGETRTPDIHVTPP